MKGSSKLPHLSRTGRTFWKRRSHPFITEQLRLRKHGLYRLLLQIRRIAVEVKDALHHHLALRPRAFAQRPVDGYALLHQGNLLRREQLELEDTSLCIKKPACQRMGIRLNSITDKLAQCRPANSYPAGRFPQAGKPIRSDHEFRVGNFQPP